MLPPRSESTRRVAEVYFIAGKVYFHSSPSTFVTSWEENRPSQATKPANLATGVDHHCRSLVPTNIAKAKCKHVSGLHLWMGKRVVGSRNLTQRLSWNKEEESYTHDREEDGITERVSLHLRASKRRAKVDMEIGFGNFSQKYVTRHRDENARFIT